MAQWLYVSIYIYRFELNCVKERCTFVAKYLSSTDRIVYYGSFFVQVF